MSRRTSERLWFLLKVMKETPLHRQDLHCRQFQPSLVGCGILGKKQDVKCQDGSYVREAREVLSERRSVTEFVHRISTKHISYSHHASCWLWALAGKEIWCSRLVDIHYLRKIWEVNGSSTTLWSPCFSNKLWNFHGIIGLGECKFDRFLSWHRCKLHCASTRYWCWNFIIWYTIPP